MGFYFSATHNVNTGKPWSEMDVEDLRTCAPRMTADELADFLCRSKEEVVFKASLLGVKLKA